MSVILLLQIIVFHFPQYDHLSLISDIITLVGSPTDILQIPPSVTLHCTKLRFPHWSYQYLNISCLIVCLVYTLVFSHWSISFMKGTTCPYYSSLYLNINDSLLSSRLLNKWVKLSKYLSRNKFLMINSIHSFSWVCLLHFCHMEFCLGTRNWCP